MQRACRSDGLTAERSVVQNPGAQQLHASYVTSRFHSLVRDWSIWTARRLSG
jgi:hypothetical protein